MIKKTQKPSKYWNDFNNIKKYLIDFYTINKRLPTYFEAKTLGFSTGITRHGGIYKIAKILDLLTSSQYKTLSGDIVQSSYEVTFANFLYLNNIPFHYEGKIIGNKGYEYDFKINDVYVEVWGYIGDEYDKKRILKEKVYEDNNFKLISIEPDIFEKNNHIINEHFIFFMKEYNIKQDNFYDEDLAKLNYFTSFNKDVIIEELQNECIKQIFKNFPTKKWWRENGFKKHIKFLERNKISIYDIADICDLKSSTTKNGYWTWELLEKELLSIIQNNNEKFPTTVYLRAIKRDDLIAAMYSSFGGIVAVRKKMNYKIEKAKTPHQIYWENIENVKTELLIIINIIGDFPTKTYLEKNHSSLKNAITRYHGGLINIKKIMGYKANEYGRYKDFENIKNELMVIYDNLGKMPTPEYLYSINRGDLVSGMQKYHGGFKSVKEKLGFEKYNRDSKWKDFENIKLELMPIYNELGAFPTVAYLNNNNKGYLVSAIYAYHDGYHAVIEKLGLKKRSRYSILRNIENIKNELMPIYNELGKMPTPEYLKSINKCNIVNAIYNYHGNFEAVKQKLNWK